MKKLSLLGLLMMIVFSVSAQGPVLRNYYTTNLFNDLNLARLITTSITNAANSVIISAGDSMADSPGGGTFSAAAKLEGRLQIIYGWAGAGPTETVDTGVGNAILSTRGDTNLYNNYSTPVYASDGSANVLASKTSSNIINLPLTEIGVIYHKDSSAGTIRLIHTATGINETNVVTATSATPVWAYTNFAISDTLTDHKLTFASATLTNTFGGFIMRNSTNRGIEFYYVAKSGASLSNMIVAGTNSLAAIANKFHPNLVLYHAKDNDTDGVSMGSFSSYSNQLRYCLETLAGTGKVAYVSTPQQSGNFDNLQQNQWAHIVATNRGWAYIQLGENFPNFRANNRAGLMADGSHPSEPVGTTQWAEFMAEAMNISWDTTGTNNLLYGNGSGMVFPTDVTMTAGLNISNNVNVGTNTFSITANLIPGATFVQSVGIKSVGGRGELLIGENLGSGNRIYNNGSSIVYKSVSYQMADLSGNTLVQGGNIVGINCGAYYGQPAYLAVGGTYPANAIVAGNAAFWNSNGTVYLLTSSTGGTAWTKTNLIASP